MRQANEIANEKKRIRKYLSFYLAVILIISGLPGLSNARVYAENGGMQNQVVNGSFEEMTYANSWVAKGSTGRQTPARTESDSLIITGHMVVQTAVHPSFKEIL